MGPRDFKLKKLALFTRKPVNINILRSTTPKLAHVPANRYNSDIKKLYVNVYVKFH